MTLSKLEKELLKIVLECDADHCGCMGTYISDELKKILGKDYWKKYYNIYNPEKDHFKAHL